ncbi:MAG: pyrroline-5-carboxylate reductase [Magnetococcales bacterium]|nr:pyrroline-5-carboxylate reductase [Magnetococcales bacterium]
METALPPDTTIAFSGGGNMAAALIQGLMRRGVSTHHLRVAEPNGERRRELTALCPGLLPLTDNHTLLQSHIDLLVLAVKPGVVPMVLQEIRQSLQPQTVVLSIAAGVTLAQMGALLPEGQPLLRAMPNTPALVGAGITGLVAAATVTAPQIALAKSVLDACGETLILGQESLLDAVTALSGSGPAYVFLMAEALSDGGVACGLPRNVADRLAIQTLLGSARLMDESGKHPGELKNQVTSPGGTTIAGLLRLEQAGVRGALMEAVMAAWKRAGELR